MAHGSGSAFEGYRVAEIDAFEHLENSGLVVLQKQHFHDWRDGLFSCLDQVLMVFRQTLVVFYWLAASAPRVRINRNRFLSEVGSASLN